MTGDGAGDRERWLDAAVTLAADPSARVPCPACGLELLRFEDRRSETATGTDAETGETVDRYLRCGFCGGTAYVGRYPR